MFCSKCEKEREEAINLEVPSQPPVLIAQAGQCEKQVAPTSPSNSTVKVEKKMVI